MEHLLPDLDACSPDVGRVGFCALGALLRGDDVDNLETLLEQDALGDRVLDGQLDAYPPRVGLGPYEAGVDDADFVQSLELLQAQGQHLSGLGGRDDPAGGWKVPSVAVTAELEVGLALNALGNIDRELDAVVAERIRRCRAVDRGATVTTQDAGIGLVRAMHKEKGRTYVAPVLAVPIGTMGTGASKSMEDDILNGSFGTECVFDSWEVWFPRPSRSLQVFGGA